jgi:hypothetical protein
MTDGSPEPDNTGNEGGLHEVTGELIGHFQQAVAADQIWRSER